MLFMLIMYGIDLTEKVSKMDSSFQIVERQLSRSHLVKKVILKNQIKNRKNNESTSTSGLLSE
jgi:hypothetical protein